MKTYEFQDSVTASHLNPQAKIAPYYADGLYENYHAIENQCPTAVLFGITVTPEGSNRAQVYDCERGDGTPAQAARWAKRQVGRRHCTIYCSLSIWDEVKRELAKVLSRRERRRVHFWIADWTGQPHIPNGAVACQWRNTPATDDNISRDKWPGVYTPLPLHRRIMVRRLTRGFHRRKVQIAPQDRHLLVELTYQTHRITQMGHHK